MRIHTPHIKKKRKNSESRIIICRLDIQNRVVLMSSSCGFEISTAASGRWGIAKPPDPARLPELRRFSCTSNISSRRRNEPVPVGLRWVLGAAQDMRVGYISMIATCIVVGTQAHLDSEVNALELADRPELDSATSENTSWTGLCERRSIVGISDLHTPQTWR